MCFIDGMFLIFGGVVIFMLGMFGMVEVFCVLLCGIFKISVFNLFSFVLLWNEIVLCLRIFFKFFILILLFDRFSLCL